MCEFQHHPLFDGLSLSATRVMTGLVFVFQTDLFLTPPLHFLVPEKRPRKSAIFSRVSENKDIFWQTSLIFELPLKFGVCLYSQRLFLSLIASLMLTKTAP